MLDDARRSGSYLQMARVLAPLVADMPLSPDAGWFAETSLEIALARRASSTRRAAGREAAGAAPLAGADRRGRPAAARRAAAVAGGDGGAGGPRPARRRDAASAGDRARRARHRRADRLWEAASRTPQPADRLPARDRRAGRPRAVGQAQRCRPHHPARHAHAGTRRPRGRQHAGARRRGAGPEAHRARSGCAAAGAGGADRAPGRAWPATERAGRA